MAGLGWYGPAHALQLLIQRILTAALMQLQFYDYQRDRHVEDVEVVPFNAVQRGGLRDTKLAHGHTVVATAFSSDGEWMLTVDHRDKGVFKHFLSHSQGSSAFVVCSEY